MNTRVILIGGFHKAKSLAMSLINKGYTVTAINNDQRHCSELAEIDKLTVFFGDGTKPFVLEDANVYSADIAIALTQRDEDNLVACELCKKKYNVKKTVSIISEPIKADFFRQMGIDSVVCAITAITNIIEQQAFLNEMATLIPIGEGRISLARVPIPAASPIIGKKLLEMDLPREVIVGCILRGEESIIPRGDSRILAGDILMLISSVKHEMIAIRELTGR
ncbi:MAG: NAD-binding protein [Clostridiales bacterium]|jgi:trk system potassium uptake protein TrkA|nr:NAD-binding protein [Clostridiales bacterium]